jgi:hypothetical protein
MKNSPGTWLITLVLLGYDHFPSHVDDSLLLPADEVVLRNRINVFPDDVPVHMGISPVLEVLVNLIPDCRVLRDALVHADISLPPLDKGHMGFIQSPDDLRDGGLCLKGLVKWLIALVLVLRLIALVLVQRLIALIFVLRLIVLVFVLGLEFFWQRLLSW